jgi:hypothetical protein
MVPVPQAIEHGHRQGGEITSHWVHVSDTSFEGTSVLFRCQSVA